MTKLKRKRKYTDDWGTPENPRPLGWIPNADQVSDLVRNRFWKFVSIKTRDECWEWSGMLDEWGYGRFQIYVNHKKSPRKAHRFAYALHYGSVDRYKCVCHSCDNRKCCNPAHLWLGTNAENSEDMVSKKRQSRGVNHPRPMRKLNDDMVRKIFSSTGFRREIGERFGVKRRTVDDIFNGKSWRHVTGL